MWKFWRLLTLALAALLMLTSLAFAEIEACPPVETSVRGIPKFGHLILDISGDALLDLGYEYGDIVTAELCGRTLEMPVCDHYSDVDVGAMVLHVVPSGEGRTGSAELCINMGALAAWLGIAQKVTIEEAPGYRWDYAEAWREGIPVRLSLKEKGGYLEQLALHQLKMSKSREDYPGLTDEQYANFRNVATTGMGAFALYRSSSPVNPAYNRNREADAAVNAAGIRTVLNLADSEAVMKGYEDYAYTYYSGLDVMPLDMVVSFEDPVFQSALAEGCRFLASHEGPYLVHCNLGKDRAGFTAAVLECLMGATADEVVADYMLSYYNYYGIEPGTEQYEAIADANIRRFIPRAFGIESLEAADLAASAEAYLEGIGLTSEEIAALKDCLGTDIQ